MIENLSPHFVEDTISDDEAYLRQHTMNIRPLRDLSWIQWQPLKLENWLILLLVASQLVKVGLEG